jgi:prevent-host-death family protein
MTMKEVPMSAIRAHRRVGVAEARAIFSEILREAARGPTVIHSRGRDLAVLLAIDEYEQLAADRSRAAGTGAAFLGRIDAVKRRHGGGIDRMPCGALLGGRSRSVARGWCRRDR